MKINEDREQHIGIIQKVIKDPAGTVTACEIRMTDGSLETVTKKINDPENRNFNFLRFSLHKKVSTALFHNKLQHSSLIAFLYLSTSPNTISSVPMMATKSANMWFLVM